VRSRYYGIRSKRWSRLFAFGLLPILLSSSSGCPKSPTRVLPPEEARLVICKDGNEVEREQWNRIVDEATRHPDQIAAGVRWAGGHLYRCGFTND